jgi:uncharacterized cupredoxin-like copper-binding protein
MAFVLLSFVAACSDGRVADTTVTPAPLTDLSVKVHEFGFEPAVVAIPAAQPVNVTLHNEGTIKHEWVVIAKGHELSLQRDFEEDAVLFEIEEVDAGSHGSGEFSISEPGTYQLICAIEGHFNAGMHATLVVV